MFGFLWYDYGSIHTYRWILLILFTRDVCIFGYKIMGDIRQLELPNKRRTYWSMQIP